MRGQGNCVRFRASRRFAGPEAAACGQGSANIAPGSIVSFSLFVIQIDFEEHLLFGERRELVAESQIVHAGPEPRFDVAGGLLSLRGPESLSLVAS